MKSIFTRDKVVAQLWFWGLALILFYVLDYFTLWHMRPQGIHFMRQTDSLSIILHYVKSGMHFWEPGILNLESIQGKTASEFPLFYYILAGLYRIFGEHESWLRMMNTLLIFLGFNALYRICLDHFQKVFLSLTLTFLLWGSMVIFYYGNNFLPDATALGLTLCGFYFMYHHLFLGKKYTYAVIGLMLMLLASLIKVSYFVYPTAFLLTYYTFDWFVLQKSWKELFRERWPITILYLIGLIGVVSWIVYIKQYNLEHNGYFLVKSKSILMADAEDRKQVVRHVTGWWADSYYPTLTKLVMVLVFIAGLLRFRKADLRWIILTSFCVAGALAFFLLFFLQFRDHDYYFLAMVPAIVLAVLFAVTAVLDAHSNQLYKWVFSILLAVTAVKGIAFSNSKMWNRYAESRNDLYSRVGQLLAGSDKEFDFAGINRNARLIIVMDPNVNGGLYFTGRFGWPIMDTSESWLNRIPAMVNEGATHFVLLDPAYTHFPQVQHHLGKNVMKTDRYQVFETLPDQ